MDDPFDIVVRPGPVITTAIHAGHALSPDVASACALAETDRSREEDPATDRLADIGATLVTVRVSRFQVDLNRPREAAVYRTPEQAWGMRVWCHELAEESVERSLSVYDSFYITMRDLIEQTIDRNGYALVVDVHSYNHRRSGPDAPFDPPIANPDVNIGTAGVDRARWGSVVDAALAGFSQAGYDARENVKFRGGAFPVWVNATFGSNACAIAVEYKKTFMDEWSGMVDTARTARANAVLRSAVAAAVRAAEEGGR